MATPTADILNNAGSSINAGTVNVENPRGIIFRINPTATGSAGSNGQADVRSLVYRVNWGDGQSDSWTYHRTHGHQYASPGTYSVSITVRNWDDDELKLGFDAVVAASTLTDQWVDQDSGSGGGAGTQGDPVDAIGSDADTRWIVVGQYDTGATIAVGSDSIIDLEAGTGSIQVTSWSSGVSPIVTLDDSNYVIGRTDQSQCIDCSTAVHNSIAAATAIGSSPQVPTIIRFESGSVGAGAINVTHGSGFYGFNLQGASAPFILNPKSAGFMDAYHIWFGADGDPSSFVYINGWDHRTGSRGEACLRGNSNYRNISDFYVEPQFSGATDDAVWYEDEMMLASPAFDRISVSGHLYVKVHAGTGVTAAWRVCTGTGTAPNGQPALVLTTSPATVAGDLLTGDIEVNSIGTKQPLRPMGGVGSKIGPGTSHGTPVGATYRSAYGDQFHYTWWGPQNNGIASDSDGLFRVLSINSGVQCALGEDVDGITLQGCVFVNETDVDSEVHASQSWLATGDGGDATNTREDWWLGHVTVATSANEARLISVSSMSAGSGWRMENCLHVATDGGDGANFDEAIRTATDQPLSEVFDSITNNRFAALENEAGDPEDQPLFDSETNNYDVGDLNGLSFASGNTVGDAETISAAYYPTAGSPTTAAATPLCRIDYSGNLLSSGDTVTIGGLSEAPPTVAQTFFITAGGNTYVLET